VRIAYADPPYPGCAHLYKDHPDYAGEVDHVGLLRDIDTNYDGWALHTNSTTLAHVVRCADEAGVNDYRIMAWVKPFAAFKRNVSVAYAWEPVLVKACRKPVVDKSMTWRDWIAESITLRRGLTGAKPDAVCRWVFGVVGAQPDDELCDLFPGSGAVTRAWQKWSSERTLLDA
jgi:hypothetical protein